MCRPSPLWLISTAQPSKVESNPCASGLWVPPDASGPRTVKDNVGRTTPPARCLKTFGFWPRALSRVDFTARLGEPFVPLFAEAFDDVVREDDLGDGFPVRM